MNERRSEWRRLVVKEHGGENKEVTENEQVIV